ncbi:MAG: methyltransferase domain-containing protein [Burkholderiales bacterium]
MTRPPDAEAARRAYAAHAAGYDASAERTMALRRATIGRLALGPGDAVLDVACGTGLSFPILRQAVGDSGRVHGVELSAPMAALARARIDGHRWGNVAVDVGDMAGAALPGPFDAVLFNFTHDVLRTPGALDNVFAACRPGARVAVSGSKLLPWWLAPFNGWVRRANAPYMTTFDGLDEPWRPLERYVPRLRRVSALWGAAYVGWGRYEPPASRPGVRA